MNFYITQEVHVAGIALVLRELTLLEASCLPSTVLITYLVEVFTSLPLFSNVTEEAWQRSSQ